MKVEPKGALGDTRTRILLEVQKQQFPTIRSVAEAVGTGSPNCYRHLLALLRDGLVTWDEYTGGSLRPLVRPIAV